MRSASSRASSGGGARRRRAMLVALVAFAGGAGAVRADEVYVICNAAVSLQQGEIKDVFIGEKGFAGSTKLAPADNSAAQAEFLAKVLKLDASKYAGIWTKKSFRDGANPPPVKGSDAEALSYVKQTPGGCSYTNAAPPPGVSVVGKF